MRFVLFVGCLALPLASAACDYPDEGTMPLHRAITKVKLLPETVAWSAEQLRRKVIVQYALYLDRDVRLKGQCYWTIEARAEGKIWRRYLVRPDGRALIETGNLLPGEGRRPGG